MRQTREIITCDRCKARIDSSLDAAKVLDMDVCKACLVPLFSEVETEYRRLIKGEVMGRRGWRNLGEYDS